MTKRTAPRLALVLALVLAVSGPVLATKGLTTSIPDVITVSQASVNTDGELTEVVLHGDFPLNYLVYQPEPNKLVIEVRDCDASSLKVPVTDGSLQVIQFDAVTDTSTDGAPVTQFRFTLAPKVSHSIDADGDDIVVRFVGGVIPVRIDPAVASTQEPRTQIPAAQPAAHIETPAETAAPTLSRSAVIHAAAENRLPGYQRVDLTEFAQQAGLDARSPARALVGVDTSLADAGRIILMLDGPASFSTFELDDPLRLVIDLELLINEVPAAVIPVTSPYMRRLRVSQFKESPQRVARAVIDLTGPSSYQVVPTAEGLSIILDRSSLPSPRDLQIARSPAPPTIEEPAAGTETPAGIAAPVRSASAATAPAVATAPGPESVSATEAPLDTMVGADTAGSSGAEMPVPAFEVSHVGSLLAQADAAGALDDVNPDDYAYYSLAEPDAAAGGQANTAGQGRTFESRTLSDDVPVYTGRRISLELVDADLKQIFRLFHEISGLNFVLDPSVAGKVTIVLDNVPWDLALDIILRNNGLDKVFEHNVMRIATTAKLASEAQQRRALKEAARMEQDPVTVSRVLSYARAEEMDQIVRRILSSGAGSSSTSQSFFDTRTNTLVYSGIPEQVEEINKLIDELDVQAPQVTIEARIIETSREFVRDLGIIWNVLVSDNPNTGTGNGFKQFSYDVNLPAKQVSNLGISFGDFGPSAATLNLTIDALEQEGHARTLSAPRIAAQNNTTAVIEQGVQIPVVNTTATEINVEFISASLKLEVTPQITAEGTVIMDIKVDNSSPDFNNTVGDTPSIVTERADTRVLVEDGGTTVIGGVFLLTEGESETGVPGLRKIPGLGWLFKKKNVTKENKELLIFITPKIMS